MGRRSALEITDSEDYSDCDCFYVSTMSDDDSESEEEMSTDSDEDDDSEQGFCDSDEAEESGYEYYYYDDDDDDNDHETEVFFHSEEEEVEEKVEVLSRVKRTKNQKRGTSKSTKRAKSTKKDAVRKPLKKKIMKKKSKSVTAKRTSTRCRKKPATTSSRKGKEKATTPAKRVAGNNSSNEKKKRYLVNRPMTFLVFDLETTGLHRIYHRIIEIALVDMDGGGQNTFHSLVDPGRPITNSHIHGITTKMVNRPDVPRMQGLIPNLLRFVKSRQKPKGYVILVAHNARGFDVPFLANEFKRCSTRIPSNWLFLDTLPLAREAMKSTGSQVSGRISLQALREHYGIPLVGSAHSAMSDVYSLSEVLQRIAVDLNLSTADLVQKTFTETDLTVAKVKKKRD